MSDITQGQQDHDDSSLFADATSTTLEKFENAADLPPPPPEPPLKPADKPAAVGEPPKPEAPEVTETAKVAPGITYSGKPLEESVA